jgi:hypothetical protein
MLKHKMHSNNTGTKANLKKSIPHAAFSVPPTELQHAINVFIRCNMCPQGRGNFFQQLLQVW